jgi:hypothetical protein
LPISERDIRLEQSGSSRREARLQKSSESVRSDEKVRLESAEKGFEVRLRDTREAKDSDSGKSVISFDDRSTW